MTDTIPETARLTADVVAISEHDGQPHVLLIRRGWDPYAGCWALPGGHVDTGEDTADAALRELKEETGIHADNLEFVRVYATPGRDPRGRYVTFAYVARVDGVPKPAAADDATEAMWAPVRELSPRSLAFDHWKIVQDALRVAVRGNAWVELRGYLQQAAADGGTIDPAAMLRYFDELEQRALAPVKVRQTGGEPAEEGGAS